VLKKRYFGRELNKKKKNKRNKKFRTFYASGSTACNKLACPSLAQKALRTLDRNPHRLPCAFLLGRC